MSLFNLIRKKVETYKDVFFIDCFFETENKFKKIFIFGAGGRGQNVLQELKSRNIPVAGFIDSDATKKGTLIDGIEVFSMPDVKNINEPYFILIASQWGREISIQLELAGIHNYRKYEYFESIIIRTWAERHDFMKFLKDNEEKFQAVYNLLEDEDSKESWIKYLAYRITGNLNILGNVSFPQYLHPEVKPKSGDIIIDGGAFDGDTVKLFYKHISDELQIHSFEPANSNYKLLEQYVQQNKLENVFVNKYGLGNSEAVLYMETDEEAREGYEIKAEGNEIVKIISIDEYKKRVGLEKVDVIKMDIEGFELKALQGALNTIKAYKPKLQICLYHNFSDLIEIPLFIHNQFKQLNYKYYVGIHWNIANDWEFLLYCK
ncbi:hypothetical protein MTP04_09480 [Lysinibacillus sp. PLM2]|nr:hypothetical protein MTP04_09480 [Lysinibacillus sp. PLM2]